MLMKATFSAQLWQQRNKSISIVYITSAYLQARERWQNVSDSCAGTDLRAGNAEEREGYQQRFNHRLELVHATSHLLLIGALSNPQIRHHFRIDMFTVVVPTKSFDSFTTPIEAGSFSQPCLIHRVTLRSNIMITVVEAKRYITRVRMCFFKQKGQSPPPQPPPLPLSNRLKFHVNTQRWTVSGSKTMQEAINTIMHSVGDHHLPNFTYNQHGDNGHDVMYT